jgi:CDP-diacylglycerol--glycerol-3-phosphate 3-phosphatidyltransferase
MKFTLPNSLTLLRIVLIPCLVAVFYLPVKWAGPAAAILFAIAGITDWFDGYLARRLEQQSRFGAFLDPVADKLMVAVALILIVDANPAAWIAIPAAIIISREITISALREWMAELGKSSKVRVSWVGKFKTTAQMIAIFALLYADPIFGISSFWTGVVLLYIAAGLTLYSMIMYLRAAWPHLVQESGA